MTFKSEEELKEFLENLGTEYRFSCFKEKNSEGCHLLADYLESVKADFEAAGKVYKSNCDEHNYPKSCFRYGNYCFLGKGMESGDCTEAFNHYKKSCDLGYANGCLHTGVMLTRKSEYPNSKNPVALDPATGIKYLEKACSGGNATACYFASGMYIAGSDAVPRDRTKASELSLKACDGGNIFSCMNLSRMYRIGDGVEKDEKMAEVYKNKAREIRDDYKKKPSIGLQQHT
ncbi:hypothetical protein JTE90_017092 [Oedothorax gibbosus]|uniref:Cytochrome c oxidase assembly factor 7 n=1 Tax=Oedothorax gibbosus TaxID=931172 RepID=A0AAV6UFL4_9ARAC|nr:hypothetical protein JTE90_017092 [Oedothorax gibbosus]